MSKEQLSISAINSSQDSLKVIDMPFEAMPRTEKLPPPERAFAAVFQNSSIQKQQEANKIGTSTQSPMDMIAQKLGQQNKQSQQKVSFTEELTATSTDYRRRQLAATMDETYSKLDQTNKAIAQLENIRNRIGQPTNSEQSKALLAINSSLQGSESQKARSGLTQGVKDIYGDLNLKQQGIESELEGDKDIFHNIVAHLTGMQTQLYGVVKEMNHVSEGWSPADLLGIQMRFAYVQQHLDFFSNSTAKVLENIKTMFNVQS
jgi:hypothetical protein